MRERLAELGVPVPEVRDRSRRSADVEEFGAWPVVLKAARGGYDGKGVWVCESPAEARDVVERASAEGIALLAEERVPFRRELAAVRRPLAVRAGRGVAGRRDRAARTASASRSSRRRPASTTSAPRRPRRSPCGIADALGVTGRARGRAVRDRPTACWSTSWRCARTTPATGRSRARAPRSSSSTCGPCSTYPLGATTPTAPYTVMANVLGGDDPPASTARYIHVHGPRPRREGAPLRQGGPAGPQDRPRHRARRRPRRRTRARPPRGRLPAAGRHRDEHAVSAS